MEKKLRDIQNLFSFLIIFCIIFCFSCNAKPLKILFVVGHFPSPSQTFILNSIIGMIDRGHNVSIFTFNKEKTTDCDSRIREYGLMHTLMHGKDFVKALIHHDYDIVLCQFGYIAKRLVEEPRLANWLKKKKLVVCFRGADISLRIQQTPYKYKNVIKKVDLCLPVCEYFKKRLVSLGFPSHKITVHHSAIDCGQFAFKARKKPSQNNTINIISVSRLVKKKGLDDAIKAVAEVVKKYKNIHFTIVGDGEERQYLELLIRQLKLEKHVTLYGWANQKEVISLLDNSHIFMLPSRKAPDGNEEGIPNALKEAMAMGLMTIATWHAGNPELIKDKVSGFLVPEKDVKRLTQTIEYIIENPNMWEYVQQNARRTIEEQFETKKTVELLEQLLYSLWK